MNEENVGQLTTVQLIDLAYEHMTRVQAKTMHHIYQEDLGEAYDERVLGTLKGNNPRIVALRDELLKRFVPLRSRLTSQQKSYLTRLINDLGFDAVISFNKDDKPGMWVWDKTHERIMTISRIVLALLLEDESTEAWSAVLQEVRRHPSTLGRSPQAMDGQDVRQGSNGG